MHLGWTHVWILSTWNEKLKTLTCKLQTPLRAACKACSTEVNSSVELAKAMILCPLGFDQYAFIHLNGEMS